MLLCDNQKNPIKFRGREVTISDKAANTHYYLCNLPVTETNVGMYIGFYLKGEEDNLDEKLSTISDEELSKIVEDGIKSEFLDILNAEVWDSIKE